ncbi:hypothetical protein DUI87_15549 [Hirundo rustica rustica]|uniref:SET domain-containing protein n=1 Tax=Hirundo rustica rustica TaxID=333673 RepID=A0A3M0JYY0_HIRRU|nr:hypothetical protein DUI87_15549 [Hirundo rustica rustica]
MGVWLAQDSQFWRWDGDVNCSHKLEYIKLKKWLKERGFEDSNLRPAEFCETGRGLMTTKALQVKAAFNEQTRSYEIRTNSRCEKYQEVFICYGPHDNQRLLLEYGFVATDNPHSSVYVSTVLLDFDFAGAVPLSGSAIPFGIVTQDRVQIMALDDLEGEERQLLCFIPSESGPGWIFGTDPSQQCPWMERIEAFPLTEEILEKRNFRVISLWPEGAPGNLERDNSQGVEGQDTGNGSQCQRAESDGILMGTLSHPELKRSIMIP